MENFIIITQFFGAVFLITFSLILHTENLLSALICKVIPFFLGVAMLLSGLYLIGVIG